MEQKTLKTQKYYNYNAGLKETQSDDYLTKSNKNTSSQRICNIYVLFVEENLDASTISKCKSAFKTAKLLQSYMRNPLILNRVFLFRCLRTQTSLEIE